MRHEINIKNFNITRRGKRHYMVGCFKLCPRVLTSSKRETNRNRKGNQDRDRSELGIGEVQIPSPEERYQGTLENHVKSWFQRAWISSLILTLLSCWKHSKGFLWRSEKHSSPALHQIPLPTIKSRAALPPTCLSSATGAFYLPQCDHLFPPLTFLQELLCLCSQCSPPLPIFTHILSPAG